MADLMMISVPEFLCVELVAAALLALWVVGRFPRLGPKSVKSALGLCVGAVALFQPFPFVVGAVVRLPYGAYAALFGCALPVFVLAFVVAAWLMRSLVSAFGGSGGGPGRQVPVRE